MRGASLRGPRATPAARVCLPSAWPWGLQSSGPCTIEAPGPTIRRSYAAKRTMRLLVSRGRVATLTSGPSSLWGKSRSHFEPIGLIGTQTKLASRQPDRNAAPPAPVRSLPDGRDRGDHPVERGRGGEHRRAGQQASGAQGGRRQVEGAGSSPGPNWGLWSHMEGTHANRSPPLASHRAP